MPAVVRGGRRQSSASPQRKAPASRAAPRGARNAPAPQGKLAALGRLDLSPVAVVLAVAAGVVVLGGVLATGARAERIGASMGQGIDGAVGAAGLTLKQIHIQGESPEATAAIARAVQLAPGQPITAIDLKAVRERVEQVPWVKSAQVMRLLPGALVVNVVEHDRLAVWQSGGRTQVIDGRGQVISGADPGRYPNLPLVVGAGADQAAADILPLIAERPKLRSRVDALVRVDQRRWDLRLRDGGLIQLPANDVESALIQLDAMDQRERLLELGFARIDMRTPDAVAVRPASADVKGL
jgi:cell division protein FtsQ